MSQPLPRRRQRWLAALIASLTAIVSAVAIWSAPVPGRGPGQPRRRALGLVPGGRPRHQRPRRRPLLPQDLHRAARRDQRGPAGRHRRRHRRRLAQRHAAGRLAAGGRLVAAGPLRRPAGGPETGARATRWPWPPATPTAGPAGLHRPGAHRRRQRHDGARHRRLLEGARRPPPTGWEQPGFADGGWPAAADLGAYGMAPWNSDVVTPDNAVGLAAERRARPPPSTGPTRSASTRPSPGSAGSSPRPRRSSAGRLPGDRRQHECAGGQQHRRRLGQRPGRVGQLRRRRLRRTGAGLAAPLLLAGTGLGQPGPGQRLERHADLRDRGCAPRRPSGRARSSGSRRRRPGLTGSSWIWYPEGDPVAGLPPMTRYFRTHLHAWPRRPPAATLVVTGDDTADVWVNGVAGEHLAAGHRLVEAGRGRRPGRPAAGGHQLDRDRQPEHHPVARPA